MKVFAVLLLWSSMACFGQVNGCSNGSTSLLDGSIQSYGLCLPQTIDGRNKGGWIALNRAGDQSNGEPECYTPGNVTIQNGFLTEIIRSQTGTCHYYPAQSGSASVTGSYKSAFVQWNSFNFTYGDVLVRAKGPSNAGITTGYWPAIWMLGAQCEFTSKLSADNFTFGGTGGIPSGACNWHSSGSEEIDIFEEVISFGTTQSHCGVFYNGGSAETSYTFTDSSVNFHIYELRWTVGQLQWVLDGTVQSACTFSDPAVPSTPMFLQMNIAAFSSTTVTAPSSMQVDWVKVCQPSPCNGNGGNIIFYDDFVTPVNPTILRPQARLARFAGRSLSSGAVMIFTAENKAKEDQAEATWAAKKETDQ